MNAVPSMTMRLLAVALLGISVVSAGCSSVNKLIGNEESIDYRSAEKGPPNLQVPPDLTQLSREDRYQVPAGRSTTTYSTYTAQQDERPAAGTTQVLPAQADITVQRDGNQRWLVVNRPAEQLYPVVREFWQELGFLIRVERPEAGVMETDWAENRAKLPQDFIRNTLGKVLDSIYSTGELDKFRTRLERSGGSGNVTEIYVTHQGMVETLTGADKTQTKWTARPTDPELEAEFLRRLMVRLGTDAERAKASVAQAQVAPGRTAVSRVSGSGAAGALQINESFDRAWRSVGLALDRGGFSVIDRDRSQGTYFVRYVDPEVGTEKERGFFSRVFNLGGGDNDAKNQPQYRLKLDTTGDVTRIVVQGADGSAVDNRAGARILDVLAEQLK